MEKKEKHIPLRMCASCRKMRPKEELLRITAQNGMPTLDLTYKAPGRGMYICRAEECLMKAEKKNAAERAFKCAADKDFYEMLRSFI